jgi:hypothetical protein
MSPGSSRFEPGNSRFGRTTSLISVKDALESRSNALHHLGSSTPTLRERGLRLINAFTRVVDLLVNLRNALIRL